MDPEQAAAEIGRRDGYAMLGQKGTQQKLERMRCDAAAQLKREDVLRQLARLAFGRVDDAVTLALRRGETELEGLEPVSYTHLDVYKRQGHNLPWPVLPKSCRPDAYSNCHGR